MNKFFPLLLSFFIFACSSQPKIIPPQWIDQPNLAGQKGAVGSSKPHFKGKTHQRRLAVSRALDELAQQNGVTVENIVMRDEQDNRDSVSSQTRIQSLQKSAGHTIHAHIQAMWTDPRNQEIYVWLIAD